MEGPHQMEGSNQIFLEAYRQAMAQRMQQALDKIAQAVNDAPDGAWINASEMIVFNEFNDLRRDAYEVALQMRADAAASTFSPDRSDQTLRQRKDPKQGY
jgi:hypothetical protein